MQSALAAQAAPEGNVAISEATEMIVRLVHHEEWDSNASPAECKYYQFSRRYECSGACCSVARVLSAMQPWELRAALNAALPRCVNRLVALALESDRSYGRAEGWLIRRNLASSLSLNLRLINDDVMRSHQMDDALFDRAVDLAGWQWHPDYPHLLIPINPDPAVLENIELNQRLERALNGY